MLGSRVFRAVRSQIQLGRVMAPSLGDVALTRVASSSPDRDDLSKKPTIVDMMEPATTTPSPLFEMMGYTTDKLISLFESGYFNATVAIQTIGIGTLIRLYIRYESDLKRNTDKLHVLIGKSEKLISQIEETYHDAYTIIKKEDRMNVVQINKLRAELGLISRELAESKAEFSKMKRQVGYIASMMKEACEKNERLALIQINRTHSYHQIATSVFDCHIKSHKDAFKAISVALRLYVEALGVDVKVLRLLEDLGNRLDATVELDTIWGADLVRVLAMLYREEHKKWFGDILNYIGYVIFDGLHKKQQVGPLSLYSLLFVKLASLVNANDYIAMNNVGFAYGMLGHLEKAKYYLEKSIDIDPDHTFPLSRFHLANICYLEDTEAGIAALRDASIRMDPSFNGSHQPVNMTPANRDLLELINTLLGEKIYELDIVTETPKNLYSYRDKYILEESLTGSASLELYYVDLEGLAKEVVITNQEAFRESLAKIRGHRANRNIRLSERELEELFGVDALHGRHADKPKQGVFEHTVGRDPVSIVNVSTLETQFVEATNVEVIDRLWEETSRIKKATLLFQRPAVLNETHGAIGEAKLATLFYDDIASWKQAPALESVERIPVPNRYIVLSDRMP